MEVNSFPHSITFNGKNSLEFSLYVSGDKTFNSPEKDYTKVSVPGRSGDLVISNNRYKNINVVYNSIIIDDYSNNVEKIRDWLLSPDGYCRLEDTYHPDEFRLACFSGPIDFDTLLLEAGSTSLSFDCKPQRFLKSAENVYDYTYITDSTDTQKIYEPLTGDSAPLYISNHYYRKEIVERYYDVDEEQIYYYDEKFVLLTSQIQPNDWVYNYKNYYILNEDVIIVNPTSQISKPLIQIDINSLKFKSNTYYKQLEWFKQIEDEPSNWKEEYNTYYVNKITHILKRSEIPDFIPNKYYSKEKVLRSTISEININSWTLGPDYYNNILTVEIGNSYLVGDIVKYSNRYYKCLEEIPTFTTWDNSNWQLIGSANDPYNGYLNYSYASTHDNIFISNRYKEVLSPRSFIPNMFYTIDEFDVSSDQMYKGGPTGYKLLKEKPNWWDDTDSFLNHIVLIKNYDVVLWEPDKYYNVQDIYNELLFKPSDWETNYFSYYEIDGKEHIPLTDVYPLFYYENYSVYRKEIGAPLILSTKSYNVGDYICRIENSIIKYYKCKTPVSTHEVWSPTKWDLLGEQPFDILTEKPSDWYWNFTNYYILSGNEYENISKDSLYNYTVSVGTGMITLKDVKIGESYYIDCENLECYDGNFSGLSINIVNLPFLKYYPTRFDFLYKNEKLIITNWPTFLSGNNTIKELETNDVYCTIKINPRWWRL